MRTGTGCKKTSVFYKAHSPEIDFTVSFYGIFDRTSGLGKCRWIKDYHIKFLTFFLKFRKKFKHILAEEFHFSFQPVKFCISSCLIYGSLRCIHTNNTFCPFNSRIQGKRAVMCEAVQNLCIFTESLNCQTVVFLIQEKSCFLSVFDVYFVFHAVFFNLDKGRKLFSDKSLGKFHSFLAADFGIASLIDTTNLDSVFCKNLLQCINDGSLKAVNSKCQRLYYQHIGKLIHNKSRKKICFSENHTTASCIHNLLAVLPCVTDTLSQKLFVDLLMFISGKHTYRNLGIGVDKSSSHRISVKIMNQNDISVYKTSHNGCDFIIIYPEAS